MDCRLTLTKNDSFLKMLHNSYLSGEKVFLLFDENGLTRTEGIIKAIYIDTPTPTIEMEDGLKIAVRNIVAVNGFFSIEYGEC